jgi:twitching motility protein PilT
MSFSKENLQSLVKVAVQHGASDIHIRANEAPCLRIRGELFPVQTKDFSDNDLLDITKILLQERSATINIEKTNELDGGYELKDLCRLRFNFFRFNSKMGIILRIVSIQIPNIRELKMPDVITEISNQRRGLVLVTGATGSGKSTTLAAMIDHINSTRATHIVTIEDPVEFIHPQKKSRITQREIGVDTDDFSIALRSALRQDPDIILIGEMRDPETVSIALKAAETGHLVLSTVHTTDAATTIGRIISLFPPTEQDDVRKRLSENIYATISQRMLKSKNKSVVIAQEIMVTSPGVKECIRGEEPISRLSTIITQGTNHEGNGSQSFDQHIMSLYQTGQITKEIALEAVTSQSDFVQNLLVD